MVVTLLRHHYQADVVDASIKERDGKRVNAQHESEQPKNVHAGAYLRNEENKQENAEAYADADAYADVRYVKIKNANADVAVVEER
jgi:hypothetical protein